MNGFVLFGASGFLGSAVLAELRNHIDQRDLLCVGRQRVSGAAFTPFDLGTGSVAELASLLAARQPEAVINCTGRTTGSAAELAVGNVTTTATLVQAVLAGCPTSTLVHLGSAAEYGLTEKYLPTRETHTPQPASDYGAAKLRATELLLQASRDRGLSAIVLRIFNPIGAGMPGETVFGNAAAQLAAAATTKGHKIVLGPLNTYRDFIGAADVAGAVRMAAQSAGHSSKGRTNSIINIGSGRARQVRDLIRQLCDVAGFTGTVEELAAGSTRSAAVSWQAADIGRAREDLGWEPSGTIIPSLSDLWKSANLCQSLSRQVS